MPSVVSRCLFLALGFGLLWGVAHAIGRFVVPSIHGLDQAISAAVNPDAYVPLVDEFFRFITDHTNFLVSVPLLSLAVAVGLYRLVQMPTVQALKWVAGWYLVWMLPVALLRKELEDKGELIYLVAALPLILIVLGAGVPRFFPAVNARKWITGLLCVDLLIFLGLFFTKHLFWNNGLPGANYYLLLAILGTFGLAIWAFTAMDDEGMRRYVRVVWLVLVTILLVDPLATEKTKSAIARPRPLSELNAPWNEALRPIPEETLRGRNSFPSGHTSGTFALLTPLFWWVRDRRARAAILMWAVLQGVSRVYTVAHFTSDCLVGAMLGFGTGTLVFFLLGGPGLRAPEQAPAPAVKTA